MEGFIRTSETWLGRDEKVGEVFMTTYIRSAEYTSDFPLKNTAWVYVWDSPRGSERKTLEEISVLFPGGYLEAECIAYEMRKKYKKPKP